MPHRMHRMLRLFAALLAALLCLSFTGCSLTGYTVQNLMAPPKANADQQSIHKLLQGSQADITFIYPKSGEHRSAVIMQDFTGDGIEDAIGFHALEDGGVEVQFLVKTGGEWRTSAAFKNTATQVDRVCFGDLRGNGVTDVLIGWGSTAGATGRTAAVTAYLYEEGEVTEHALGTYGEMAVTDLDGNGTQEVFTIDKYVPAETEGGEPSPARAHLYAFGPEGMQETALANADNSISSYSAIVFGRLTRSCLGVVVDGAKADGSMTTQIFTLEEGRLKNTPSGVNRETYFNPFSRPSTATFTSRDIDDDGRIELPVVTLLPGIPADVTPDATSYLVEWDAMSEEGGYHRVARTLMNPRENYWFKLPYQFFGCISALNDADRRTVTYTEVVRGQELLGAPLFSIRVFTRSAWESRGQTSGYELLTVQGDSVYGIQILTHDASALRAIGEITGSFRLIAE